MYMKWQIKQKQSDPARWSLQKNVYIKQKTFVLNIELGKEATKP